MPRGDRTGPARLGPRSGRAAGYCGGYEVAGYVKPGPGRGRGRGFGPGARGRGRRFGGGGRGLAFAGPADRTLWVANHDHALDAEVERQALRNRADALRAQLRAVESRLGEDGETTEKPE
jgi:hypothetical protein